MGYIEKVFKIKSHKIYIGLNFEIIFYTKYFSGISVPKISSTETNRSPLTSAVIRPTSTASMASVTSTTKVVFGLTNSSSRHPIQTSLISSQPVRSYHTILKFKPGKTIILALIS